MSKTRNFPALIYKLLPASIDKKPAMVWIGAFLLCLAVVLFNVNSSRDFVGNIEEFEVGKVADRDVIADRDIGYVDENATQLRIEAQEQLVPAVFNYSDKVTDDIKIKWDGFINLVQIHFSRGNSREIFRLALQSDYPGDFPVSVLDLLYQSQERDAVLAECELILDAVLEKGIYSVPHEGLELLNPDVVELIRQSGSRIEQERVSFLNITTIRSATEAVAVYSTSFSNSQDLLQIAPQLLGPFLKENVFYSPEDTIKRLIEARSNTEPVIRNIEQGKRIIKKGFVVTEEEMAELRALRMSQPETDLPLIFAYLLFLLLLFGLLFYFSGRRGIGRSLTERESYLVAGLSVLYIAGSVLVRSVPIESMPRSVMVPTALVIMLPAILVHSRLALLLAMVLPLGAYLTGSFDGSSFIFAMVSGVVASYALQGAEKRMDLVKAGLIIAAANFAAMIAVLLWQRSAVSVYPTSLFWAAFNGVASGMLVLGVLPPLEHALNAATTFRLIELSDLNAPVLRRLFTVAPGTYSHSIMVASLAEAACQDIGANPLLARVGAYYHDLGKMENPDYFIENQTDHNLHDDIAPRLSATVIRSHVKLGVEKARQLGLPLDVINIIGEHHGNSVISFFYSKALRQESETSKKGKEKDSVNLDDFTYLGNPPHSRESAVVMLADVSEAAVRTLDKPTASKMEKYIQELIQNKVEHGQLAQSELTFRDLETIKNAFVRVLLSYHHTRIEYPKLEETQVPEAAQR